MSCGGCGASSNIKKNPICLPAPCVDSRLQPSDFTTLNQIVCHQDVTIERMAVCIDEIHNHHNHNYRCAPRHSRPCCGSSDPHLPVRPPCNHYQQPQPPQPPSQQPPSQGDPNPPTQ